MVGSTLRTSTPGTSSGLSAQQVTRRFRGSTYPVENHRRVGRWLTNYRERVLRGHVAGAR
jgi:hypothetical protein